MYSNNEIDINLLLNYPLISKSIKEDGTVTYKGIIEINDEDYSVSILQSAQNSFTVQLPESLKQFENYFKTSNSPDIISYLDLIKKHVSSNVPQKKPSNHCEIFRQVLHEYQEFTLFFMNLKSSHISYDLSKINVIALDEQNREHPVEIRVNFEDKANIFEISEYDLPCEKDKFKKSSYLKDVYNQFVQMVESLQPFFNLMDDFDANCDILDPVPQHRRHNYRRIWLGDSSSIVITVDPFKLSEVPVITFLGPEGLTDIYVSMNRNVHNWSPTNDLYHEILKFIELESFPRKPAVPEDEKDGLLLETGGCSICFSLKLDDKFPEIFCKNKSCNNCYHIECLYEWLESVKAPTVCHKKVGACPNCEKAISCPIPS
ncbi:unnamed protein product [Phyllotreta striolata]|uniref:RING-type domain-containing protein n=1 Tax=Phyllotreta striolata TaxID=444603 RepID=A0A9N9XR03_PHYSR|nr:unnamed protein product [Phyllotreta striolata]